MNMHSTVQPAIQPSNSPPIAKRKLDDANLGATANMKAKLDPRFKRPLVPLHALLKQSSGVTAIDPYQPQAVFRSQANTAHGRSAATIRSSHRKPLVEFINNSPTHRSNRGPSEQLKKIKTMSDAARPDETSKATNLEQAHSYGNGIRCDEDQEKVTTSAENESSNATTEQLDQQHRPQTIFREPIGVSACVPSHLPPLDIDRVISAHLYGKPIYSCMNEPISYTWLVPRDVWKA
jgi:hypothetical protein